MLTYRPHIDGLRAIAVLSVLVFHLEKSLLPGGFVGVDIFFVISGYLISRLIIKELDETGDFSFKNFYLRRARRLFPALAATLALCLVGAYFFLSPVHLLEFAWSAVYAILSVSNVYFWHVVDYFDSAVTFKPLLHTWSLGVEEQFYFIWPLLLFLLYRLSGKGLIVIVLVVLGVASFVLNELLFNNRALVESWFTKAGQPATLDVDATAFYLLPFRVFEFAIGAALALTNFERLGRLSRTIGCALGLAMLAYSIIFLHEELDFPSFNALWPCLGAALVIASGSNHSLGKILTNTPIVWVGLISYSLYLVHWPIIVFYKMGLFRPLATLDYVYLSAASIGLAALSYQFVEQPFRRQTKRAKSTRKFLGGTALVAIALIAVSATAFGSQGWVFRYPKPVLEQLTRQPEDYIELFSHVSQYYSGDFNNTGKPKVLVIGDSMSADLINAFVQGGSVSHIDLTGIRLYYPCLGIFPLSATDYAKLSPNQGAGCVQQREQILDRKQLISQADTVILASYWWDIRVLPYLDSTAEFLQGLGVKNVMVLGQKVQQFHGVKLLSGYSLQILKQMRVPLDPHVAVNNQNIRDARKAYHYFDLTDQFCNQLGCRQMTDEGFLIVYDIAHLTPEGAAYVGRNFVQQAWFKKILGLKK